MDIGPSLAHQEATQPLSATPMSEEDGAFLEHVMKDGIIDENERMKVILQEFSKAMEYHQEIILLSQASTNATTGWEEPPDSPPISEDELEELLEELRDIVEQVDYA